MTTHDSYRILVIEDEFIIADTIERHLIAAGHTVSGKAIACDEAIELYEADPPQLALVDIRLSGPCTGIDFARYLRSQTSTIPFIYLTSQMDPATLELAKATFPAGYLTKPVQMSSLTSTIAIAMHNHAAKTECETVTLHDGRSTHIVTIDDICYLQADHVYVKVHLSERSPLVLRTSLAELQRELPADRFVQPHRSYVVNLQCITRYERDCLHLGKTEVPVSRSRRAEIMAAI